MQSKLSLPIPKVLDWQDTALNPVGAEYIIQEHVAGVELHHKWHEMSPEQHMLCTKALSLTIKKMASLDFPAYGSLYFSDAPLESSKKIPLEEGFCIGPHCSPVFWNCNPGELELYSGPSPDCGPCKFCTTLHPLDLTLTLQIRGESERLSSWLGTNWQLQNTKTRDCQCRAAPSPRVDSRPYRSLANK